MEQASESREILMFLSNVSQGFERGVELVEVDLRWGITEEERRQCKVIPICLGEISQQH